MYINKDGITEFHSERINYFIRLNDNLMHSSWNGTGLYGFRYHREFTSIPYGVMDSESGYIDIYTTPGPESELWATIKLRDGHQGLKLPNYLFDMGDESQVKLHLVNEYLAYNERVIGERRESLTEQLEEINKELNYLAFYEETSLQEIYNYSE